MCACCMSVCACCISVCACYVCVCLLYVCVCSLYVCVCLLYVSVWLLYVCVIAVCLCVLAVRGREYYIWVSMRQVQLEFSFFFSYLQTVTWLLHSCLTLFLVALADYIDVLFINGFCMGVIVICVKNSYCCIGCTLSCLSTSILWIETEPV